MGGFPRRALLLSLLVIQAASFQPLSAAAPKTKKSAAKADPSKAASVKPALGSDSPNVIESVGVQVSGRFAKVVIQSTRALKIRDIAQADGLAVSLYMTEPTLSKRPPIEKASGDLVEEIRYGYQGAKIPEGTPIPLDYLTIRLKEPVSYTVSQRDWIFQVELKPRGGTLVTSTPVVGMDEDSGSVTPLRKDERRATLPSNPTLQDFLQVGLANHVPLRLAEDEYRLAKMRYFEAVRGMLPTATGRYEQSKGKLLNDPNNPLDDVHFIRKELGVQLGEPLFQSGKLYYTARQMGAQKKAAAQNVKKVRADMLFEITKAYHNLIKSQRALKVRRELMERMDKVIEMTRKKRQLELITESDALGAESQYSQAYYHLLSDEKDLEISRLRLEALLNLPEPLPETITDPADGFDPKNLVDLNVPVETFVDLAFKHRPEMLSAEYAALAGIYGAKAARADGLLHVDLSGFVGKSGAGFVEDPLNPLQMRSSWNIGIQGSFNFLGNTVKGLHSKDHSTPDYGETTATDVSAYSANVGFLDGLKYISDARQAAIGREKALYDREQARRNIEVDVREAYYNIQKAKIQIKGAQQELDFRQKELGISRQKERMNMIEPSQSLQAETSYGESVNAWEEATAFYKVSLASLAKAVGMTLDSIAELK